MRECFVQSTKCLLLGAAFHPYELCHDISAGSLSTKIPDPALTARLEETFMPSPKPELDEQSCIQASWKGIIRRIWPNVEYLAVVVTARGYLKFVLGARPQRLILGFGINLYSLCAPSELSHTEDFEFIPLDSPSHSQLDQRKRWKRVQNCHHKLRWIVQNPWPLRHPCRVARLDDEYWAGPGAIGRMLIGSGGGPGLFISTLTGVKGAVISQHNMRMYLPAKPILELLGSRIVPYQFSPLL
ncbi:LOW QUALITY PROTEIN: hypothetical protein Cgig2_004793 [Carnegiea gigantea]|uniref:Uncharacterized protein n=1 Tax=Carnegiea gigantea TaxID=171969 RepID=A0A9Q1KWX5_9CARY|nr:LOW QUALITY PROTEIN: hypothetical protein Cgig2_004793 [Carnegiea gigantea]